MIHNHLKPKKITMEEIISRVNKLPEISKVTFKVSKMLEDLNVNYKDLSSIITLDPVLTTMLLKLCNSSYYGFSRRIISVNDAIAKLGTETVKNLVFVALSQGILDKKVQGYSLNTGDLSFNSITCAYYSRYIAAYFHYKNPDLAFIAGLLRDIGKLIIDEYVGVNYNQIVEMVKFEQISFCRAEEMIIGYNHAQIAYEMLNYWKFPFVITQSIRYHHDLLDAYNYYGETLDDVNLIAILHLADALTGMLGNAIGSDGLMYYSFDQAFNILSNGDSNVNIDLLIDDLVDLNSEITTIVKVIK